MCYTYYISQQGVGEKEGVTMEEITAEETVSLEWIAQMIDQMKESGNYHNPTLEEIEDRLN
jgi:hypothetical protein